MKKKPEIGIGLAVRAWGLLLFSVLGSLKVYAFMTTAAGNQRGVVSLLRPSSSKQQKLESLLGSGSRTEEDWSATTTTTTASAGGGTAETKDDRDASKKYYLATFKKTLEFPCYNELMKLKAGEFVTSETFTVAVQSEDSSILKEYDFCVKLYPRGGGHKAKHSIFDSQNIQQNNQQQQQLSKTKDSGGGFGMLFGGKKEDEKVGAYLQFLPRYAHDSVDASFALQLKGRQRGARKFDVEWRSGMRFVSVEQTKLQEGRANDFGAHLMQTQVLDFFLGIISIQNDKDDDENYDSDLAAKEPIQMHVEVLLHAPLGNDGNDKRRLLHDPKQTKSKEGLVTGGLRLLRIDDLRTTGYSSDGSAPTEPLRVGRIVVPVLRKLSQRPKMFQRGIYPGVEYRLLRILVTDNDDDDVDNERDLFYSKPGAFYELKPIYPLVPQLERPWPVRVNEADIPKLITPTQYNLISAVGSVLAATTALMTAFVISQTISLFFIPSKSMEPTLQKGDVLLVEKVTPRLLSWMMPPHVGDVVLFHPPRLLQELVERSPGGNRISDRDLFVKRVAAVPGDSFTVVDKVGHVQINGKDPSQDRTLCTAEPLRLIEQYINPDKGQVTVQPGQVAVLGDCSSVSVDSRVWGALPTEDIVGRPIVRLWPLSRFGPVESLPETATMNSRTNNWNE